MYTARPTESATLSGYHGHLDLNTNGSGLQRLVEKQVEMDEQKVVAKEQNTTKPFCRNCQFKARKRPKKHSGNHYFCCCNGIKNGFS